jgi:hypothetical protein
LFVWILEKMAPLIPLRGNESMVGQGVIGSDFRMTITRTRGFLMSRARHEGMSFDPATVTLAELRAYLAEKRRVRIDRNANREIEHRTV